MENIEIINVVVEVNDNYDPNKSCNGGCYYQPTITIDFSDGSSMTIDDTSCGDFGTRIMAVYTPVDGLEIRAYYGSMLEDWNIYSNFTDSYIPVLESVEAETGYHIPLNTDIRNMVWKEVVCYLRKTRKGSYVFSGNTKDLERLNEQAIGFLKWHFGEEVLSEGANGSVTVCIEDGDSIMESAVLISACAKYGVTLDFAYIVDGYPVTDRIVEP